MGLITSRRLGGHPKATHRKSGELSPLATEGPHGTATVGVCHASIAPTYEGCPCAPSSMTSHCATNQSRHEGSGLLRRRALRGGHHRHRPLPDFLILGAQKVGTTALYQSITQHPRVGARSVAGERLHRRELHTRGPFLDRFASRPSRGGDPQAQVSQVFLWDVHLDGWMPSPVITVTSSACVAASLIDLPFRGPGGEPASAGVGRGLLVGRRRLLAAPSRARSRRPPANPRWPA